MHQWWQVLLLSISNKSILFIESTHRNMASDPGFLAALAEARRSFAEGGIPIGACAVDANGKILGQGHNERVQKGSPILHGETAALDACGRLPAIAYKGGTMYTTLSPCDMW